MMTEKAKNHILRYVICTFGSFVLLMLTLGGIATIVLHGTPAVMRWVTVITAWTPTYIFLLMFKKLYPNSSLKAFYKNAFQEKLDMRLLVTTTGIQITIIVLCVYMVSVQRGASVLNLLDFSFSTVSSAFFFALLTGATGEETGWRGYLQPVMENKYGVVKGSLAVGLIWAFWHAPIWFLGTGYSGTVLIKYIAVFAITITALGFIMGICYHRCRNLFVPIWIHFTFNFLGQMFKGDLVDLVTWYAVFYCLMAVGCFILSKKQRFLRRKEAAHDKGNGRE